MSTTIGSLLIELRAQTDNFTKGVTSAKDLAFTSSQSIVQSFEKIGQSLTRMKFGNTDQIAKSLGILGGVAAAVGTAVVGATLEFAKSTAEQAKEMDKLSQSYGVPIQQITALRVAAKLTGVDLETLTNGFGRLARNISPLASSGATATKAMQALGISIVDGNGKLRPMTELVGDIADKFSHMEDGTTKTALAMALFGRAGATMVPFLNQGRERLKEMNDIAERLGLTWSLTDANAAKVLTERIELLELQGTAFKENMAKGVIPELNLLGDVFLRTNAQGENLAQTLGQAVGAALLHVARTTDTVVTGFRELSLRLTDLLDLAQTLASVGSKGLTAASPDIAAYLANRSQRVKEYEALNTDWLDRMAASYAPSSPIATITGGRGPAPPLGTAAEIAGVGSELDKLTDRAAKLTTIVLGGKGAAQDDALHAIIRDIQDFKAAHPETIWAGLNDAINRANEALRTYDERQRAALQEMSSKAGLAGLNEMLGVPVAAAGATGEAQNYAAQMRFLQDVNAQNQERLRLFDQTRTSAEQYAAELTKLNFLYSDKSSDEYQRAVRQLQLNFAAAFDPTARYQQEIDRLNDALRSGLLTEQQRIEAERQLRMLRIQSAAASPGGGAGAGIRGGLAAVAGEWGGIKAESMQATISALRSMQGAFSSFFQGVLMGTESIGQAFLKLGADILGAITSALAELLAKWIVTHIAMRLISQSSGVTEAASYAAVGAAAAGASVAAIPLVGWALAPGVMATQYALGMTYAALASAREGFDVVGNPITQLHHREMVLPQPIADVVRGAAYGARGSGAGAAAPVVSPNVNVSFTVSAIDSQSVADFFHANRGRMAAEISAAVKNGMIKVRR